MNNISQISVTLDIATYESLIYFYLSQGFKVSPEEVIDQDLIQRYQRPVKEILGMALF